MNLIKIDCKDKLKKVINIMKRGDGDFEFILASELIKRKHLPKKASVTLGKFLIPPINIINNYLATGKERKYEREYMSHLSRPEILFIINNSLKRCMENGKDMCIVCAEDELEYKYLDILTEFIEMNWGIKAISLKKFEAGKKSSMKLGNHKFMDVLETRQNKLIHKLEDIGVNALELLYCSMDKSDIKKLDPSVRKKAQEFFAGYYDEEDY